MERQAVPSKPGRTATLLLLLRTGLVGGADGLAGPQFFGEDDLRFSFDRPTSEMADQGHAADDHPGPGSPEHTAPPAMSEPQAK